MKNQDVLTTWTSAARVCRLVLAFVRLLWRSHLRVHDMLARPCQDTRYLLPWIGDEEVEVEEKARVRTRTRGRARVGEGGREVVVVVELKLAVEEVLPRLPLSASI